MFKDPYTSSDRLMAWRKHGARKTPRDGSEIETEADKERGSGREQDTDRERERQRDRRTNRKHNKEEGG